MRQNTKISRRSGHNKNQQKMLRFDDWNTEMPQWLKDAYVAVENGQTQEAARLLEEKTVQKAMDGMSGSSRTFTRYGVASLLSQIGQIKRAEELYQELLKTNRHSAVYNDLATIYRNTGRLNKAIRCLKTAIDKDPDEPILLGNLGSNLMNLGQIDKAIELTRKVTERLPDNNGAYSNLLLYMHYLPEVDRAAIFEESRKWARRNMPQRLARTSHRNTPDPERKLRIGYVSPDFRNHSVTYFFEPLLDGHNRDIVEIYGYGNIYHYDNTTERLKSKFDYYRNIRPLDDKAAAELIENDCIDILVDLAGHSANSRIYAMAYKPAPVQATWLGYPDTTGMSQIDYRLTDSIADPAGSEKFYSEKLFYLPDIFLCYGPGDVMPAIAPLPFFKRGHITFGSFNNSTKINPLVIELWSRILKQTPNSQLLLKFKSGQDDEIREMFIKRFEQTGISHDRIVITGWLPSPADLELYNQVDIALDTFPYNGTTTTCQSLLMGVPVISLVGQHHMSRVGLSILTNLGLEFFTASTPDEYVAKACALAAKPDALAKIRASMRTRMAASPLCNNVNFAKNIERAYRQMWQDYCRSKGVEIKPIESRQEADYKARKYSVPTVVDLISNADKLYRAGQRKKAVECAAKALDSFSSKNSKEKPPKQLLERYNADNLESLIFNFFTELFAYSSYFAQEIYWKLYCKIKEFYPFLNIEVDFRLGLLVALRTKLKNEQIQDQFIKLLEKIGRELNNERSKAVLALAKGDLKELSLPYDLARIHLYPDLENITTYVLLEQGDWFEKSDLNFFRSIIRPDDTVLDLGANVGVYSLSAAARTAGKVIAIEPARQTFELLEKSARQFPNMTAVHAAISDKPGSAFLSHGGSSENFKLSNNRETQGEKVSLVTVDDLARTHGIKSVDIIKMDVEGHELKALAGAEKIISKGSPIIFYEVKHGSDLHPELIDAFKDLGYDSYFTLPDAKTLIKYDNDTHLDDYLLNMIAIRPESLSRLEGLVNIEQPLEQVCI